MGPASAAPNQAFEWVQRDLSLVAYEGNLTTQSLDLAFQDTAQPPGIKIDGNLASVASVDISAPTVTSPGRASVRLHLDLPAQAKSSYAGNVQLTHLGRPLAQPLHVEVTTARWDAQTIPLEPSTPSPDRITEFEGTPVVTDTLTVTLKDGLLDSATSIRRLAASYGAQIAGAVNEANLFELRLPGATIDGLIPVRDQLKSDTDVAGASLTFLATSASVTNDVIWQPSPEQRRAQNWNLTQIDAPAAWEKSTGSGVKVGVIDSGFYANHEDLADNVLFNRGTVGPDDHGTHVAGTACATGNNRVGLAGVAWNCELVLQSFNATPRDLNDSKEVLTTVSRMVLAMREIAKTDALKIVNMSLALATEFPCDGVPLTRKQSVTVEDYAHYRELVAKTARDHPKILWVFAAGNEPVQADCSAWGALGDSPANPNIISVAAVNKAGNQASYSVYGKGVTVAAPGGETDDATDGVWSSNYVNCSYQGTCLSGYGYMHGTSMAAPHVAGVAALVLDVKETMTPAEVKQCIVAGAVAGGKKITGQSYYNLNASKAVDCASGALGGGLLTGIKDVVAGHSHGLALSDTGKVWAWGSNYGGQIGNGSTTTAKTPELVAGLDNVASISAGVGTSFAIKTDGSVWAWGDNMSGQLGTGTTENATRPVRIAGVPAAKSLTTGSRGNTFLTSMDGSVYAWGHNWWGELGLGSNQNNVAVPTRVEIPTPIGEVISNSWTTYALGLDGSAWAWGDNSSFQLGNGTRNPSTVPIEVAGVETVQQLASGGNMTTYALRGIGPVLSWGASSPVPSLVSTPGNTVEIEAGGDIAFARTSIGDVHSWGIGSCGSLGINRDGSVPSPTPIQSLSNVLDVETNGYTSYAILQDGTVRSWGLGANGQRGDGTFDSCASTPVPVANLDKAVKVVTTDTFAWGQGFAFALQSDGSVWTWGVNSQNQLGQGGGFVGPGTPESIGIRLPKRI